MSPTALALVLSAAVFHALWNRTLKTTGDRVATMAVANLIAGIALAPAWLTAGPWAVLPLVALSAGAESVYALCLSAAYHRGALSVAYPLGRGMAPLLVTLGGLVVLSQRPGPLAIGGAVALAAGMALVATAGRRAGQGHAVAFALLAGVGVASYSVIDARAVRAVAPPGYLGVVLLLTGLVLTAYLGADRRRPRGPIWPGARTVSLPGKEGTVRMRLREAIRPGVQVAIGSTAAYLLVLLAFQRAHAGKVATLREVSVLIGIWLSGERPGRRIWAGAAFVVAGILLAAV